VVSKKRPKPKFSARIISNFPEFISCGGGSAPSPVSYAYGSWERNFNGIVSTFEWLDS